MNDPHYWKDYYNIGGNVASSNPQRSVGRTKNGQAIRDDIWLKTIDYLRTTLSIAESDHLLELCCGNGMVINNLARYCSRSVGVDFSSNLLRQLRDTDYENRVETVDQNILNCKFKKEEFDVIVIYFSIQHFSEKETLETLLNCYRWLKHDGRLFIGDIPDMDRKWEYINQPEYQIDYLERILTDTPKIGTWFQKEFFKSIVHLLPDSCIYVLDQPSFQINSDIRFDVLIRKGS